MAKKIIYSQKAKKKITGLILNKIKTGRHLVKKITQKIRSRIGFIGILLFLFIIFVSLFYPQSEIQRIKSQLIRNPFNFDNHLTLAKKFIENHQFAEAERTLLLAEKIANSRFLKDNLKKETIQEEKLIKLEGLWQEKNMADPKDIQRLIASWEKIIAVKPDYRDGYLQLAFLNYKINQTEKALLNLNKALELDSNFEVSLKLKKIITQP